MAALVESGRTPKGLAREYEPSAAWIRNWVKQAERDAGEHHGGLTTAEWDELCRLRREVRQFEAERDIRKKSRGAVRSGDRGSAREILELLKANHATYGVRTMSRVLGVAASGYYACLQRPVRGSGIDDSPRW